MYYKWSCYICFIVDKVFHRCWICIRVLPQRAAVRTEWENAVECQTPCRHSIRAYPLLLTIDPFPEQAPVVPVPILDTHQWLNICFETKSLATIFVMPGSGHSSPGIEMLVEVISDFWGNSNDKFYMKLC